MRLARSYQAFGILGDMVISVSQEIAYLKKAEALFLEDEAKGKLLDVEVNRLDLIRSQIRWNEEAQQTASPNN